MGSSLSSPITEKESQVLEASNGLLCGASGMQGWRLEMEDQHIMCEIPGTPGFLLLAVFDGHGGKGAAIFAEAHLMHVLQSTSEWHKFLDTKAEDPEIIGNALIRAFVELDAQLREHQLKTMSNPRPDMSGCTAVCAIVTPKFVICANAGDSRCVLGTNGVARPMSFDHKPHSAYERKRIEDAGGTVQWKRVDGDLAVSRAFGDFQFKARADLGPHQQKVSCVPDVEVYDRNPAEDDLLVLACDGVWDVLSNEAALDTVRQVLAQGETSPDLIAEELIDTALNLGSMDNISAIVARFPAAKLGDPALGGVAALRREREAKHAAEAEGGSNEARSTNAANHMDTA